MNIALMADSYKVGHWLQYPPNTTRVYSYFESRTDPTRDVVFFGLSYYLQAYLSGQVITQEKIDEAAHRWRQLHMGGDFFNRAGWEHILREHGGGLPLHIKAAPEGMVTPGGNVLFTVENTDPQCYWLTSWVETLLCKVWYPCTVATQSREMKKVLERCAAASGADPDVRFKLHDFGYRGVSSEETAGLGAAAHLISFLGSDTMAGTTMLSRYYIQDDEVPGFSIPAAEHSTMTAWGREGELAAYENMLDQFPEGLVAVVSDSYDIFNAVENLWGGVLRDRVVARDGTVVIRPDSGDPGKVVPKLLTILADRFGYETTVTGHRRLPASVRLIQGDGIDFHTLGDLCDRVLEAGFSLDNLAFGSGGGLLQKVNRDTYSFAYKASWAEIDGRGVDVFKEPITDAGKTSKRGRLALVDTGSGGEPAYATVAESEADGRGGDLLETVFLNGEVTRVESLPAIRERARTGPSATASGPAGR